MRSNIQLERLSARIGHNFQNPQLLEVALTHRSCGSPNNERLEFLGDSILNFVITQEIFERYSVASEGHLSTLRAQLVKGDTLAEIAQELDLGENLILGQGERKSGGHRRPSILADAVEALIGAIYKDAGFEQAQSCIYRLYATRLEGISASTASKDAKTQLQEWLQARKKPLPEYVLISSEVNSDITVAKVECLVHSSGLTTQAEASNRKLAEKQAAELMLKKLGVKRG